MRHHHHYHYNLGAAGEGQKTALGIEYVLTPTAAKDGFESLFAAYRAAYPASMTSGEFARELCRVNGISFSLVAIENWVFGLSGERFAFVPNNSPESVLRSRGKSIPENLRGKGWSHFGAGNMILLPKIPRADGKTPGVVPSLPSPVAVVETPPASPPPVVPLVPAPPFKKEETQAWWESPVVLAGAAFLLVAVALSLDDDKKKKPTSPSPSSMSA